MSTEEKGLAALDAIEAEIGAGSDERGLADSAAALCESYRKIKEPLQSALELIEKFPFVGKKVANAVRFLMRIADAVCQ